MRELTVEEIVQVTGGAIAPPAEVLYGAGMGALSGALLGARTGTLLGVAAGILFGAAYGSAGVMISYRFKEKSD